MRTTIDKAGRLVIPRRLRERVGLIAGGPVEIDVQGAAILVEPMLGDDLQKEGDLVVIPGTGDAISDSDVREQRFVDQR